MKKEVSPAVFISVIAVVLLIAGLFIWRTWVAPSSVPVAKTGGRPIGPGEGGGGPPPDALRMREEYNRTHPDASKGH